MRRTEPTRSRRIVATVRFTRTVTLQWLVASVVAFFGFAYCFGAVASTIHGRSLEPITIPALSTAELAGWSIVALVVVALIVAVHELLHGVAMAAFGGSPEYGLDVSRFLFPYAYAASEGTRYSRGQLLVALLTPVVAITVVGLAASVVVSSPLLPLVLAVNAAGSTGDLWMAAVVSRYPADVRIGPLADEGTDGFAIYATDDRDHSRAGADAVVAFCRGFLGTLTVLVVGGLAVVLLSLAVGSGTVVLGNPDGGWFLLRHERLSTGGAALEVGASLIARLSILGGGIWLLASRLVRAID
ncbi:DUF3267 domain-containing protein [Halopiger goleimassiliensis]|uniref:DUF3267 domain-containing protein n=1 Tax=Halopiger goleimassiliensis TaxID=1293048 RepID=UPI000677E8D8|nr:DUF3267 domain-containing protein [Halopiger goleimassiliensis]